MNSHRWPPAICLPLMLAALLGNGVQNSQTPPAKTATAGPSAPTAARDAAEVTAAVRGARSEDERIRALALPFLTIPPGTFMMGCSPTDKECQEREKPSHSVTITRSFDLMVVPVTAGQFAMWAQADGRHQLPQQPEWSASDVPVVNVTWDEARAFCSFVGGRLPTEAEWEYAARAGTTGARYGTLDDITWYGDNSGDSQIDAQGLWNQNQSGYDGALRANGNRAHAVGTKQPNAFGLYDMIGNVYQWTADWYGENYYKESVPVDPRGPGSGEGRVLRGGSWMYSPRWARASNRFGSTPSNRGADDGFRCARDAHSPVTVSPRVPKL